MRQYYSLNPYPGGKGGTMQTDTKSDVLKRLNFIDGHLAGIRRMVEADKYCVDVLKQTYAVRRAIEKMEGLMLEGHLHTCVVEGIREGRDEQVLTELSELYEMAGK
jgi:DNA-binding FrmR family transcriptional regulator